MNITHTPGPWFHIGQGDVVTMSKSGEVTGDVAAAYCTHGPEGEANARLIAAAPDLLRAAQNVLSHKRGEDDWLILAIHCRELEEAIAKATGRAA